MQGFTASQVMKLVGIKYQTLHNWARTGFVVPSLANEGGTGNRRRWSFQDVVAVKTAVMLRGAGVSLQGIRRVVAHIQSEHGIDHPLASTRLVVANTDVVFCPDDSTFISVLRTPGQVVMRVVLELGAIVAQLRKDVARLAA